MKKILRAFTAIAFLLITSFSPVYMTISANAMSPTVVITGVQTGGATAGEEFIEIYNNSSNEVAVGGWKIQYQSANPSNINTWTTKFTFPEDSVIGGNSFMLLSTSEFKATLSFPGMVTAEFSSILAAGGGHVRIFDSSELEVDKLGYGDTAVNPETSPAQAPGANEAAKRCSDESGVFVDTDDNSKDFKTSSASLGEFGPSCLVTQPDNGDDNSDGGVVVNPPVDPIDPAPTIYSPIVITELLPNPGSPLNDDQDEFIELYNPSDEAVNIAGYIVKTGLSSQYSYTLPSLVMPAKSFYALYSKDSGLTLSNSGSKASISAPDSTVLHESSVYSSAAEDISWAYVGSEWVATDRVTPGAANLGPTVVFEETGGKGALAPCPPGKFRNPATNRCKTVASESTLKPCNSDQFRNPETNRCKKKGSDSAALKACAPDQYRNPETNRCKKLSSASSSLKPCNSDQVRNPETNRCKKIGSSSGLTPCKEGYQRNPETNRCRKVAGVNTNSALSNVASTASNPVSYTALLVVGSGVVAYGFYEYRSELYKFFRSVKK